MKGIIKFGILILVVLILNGVWEFLHYPLYIDLSGIQPMTHLIQSSLVDAGIIGIIFLLITWINDDLRWLNKPEIADYLMIIVIGLFVSAIIEYWALTSGRWAYTENMPTFLGLGVTPLVQLAATSVLALLLIRVLPRNN